MIQPSSSESKDKTALVQFQLEISLDELPDIYPEFLRELGDALDVDPATFSIVDVRLGCVLLWVRMREVAAERLAKIKKIGKLISSCEVSNVRRLDEKAPDAVTSRKSSRERGINIKKAAALIEDPDLSWLHISDLHLSGDAGEDRCLQENATRQLQKDLPELLSQWDVRPDCVFLTGDLTRHGADEDYVEVGKFIESIKARYEDARVMCVPGNHDIDFAAVHPEGTRLFEFERRLEDRLTTHRRVIRHFSDPEHEDRERSLARLERFDAFVKNAEKEGLVDVPSYDGGYFRLWNVEGNNGLRAVVAGLNSSWRCTDRREHEGLEKWTDYGRLMLGMHQMRVIQDQVHASEADVRIALIHHPPNSAWFKEFDREAHEHLNEFDYVLSGHMHSPTMTEKLSAEGETMRIDISAGAFHHPHDRDAVVERTEFNCKVVNRRERKSGRLSWNFDGAKWEPNTSESHLGLVLRRLPETLGELRESAR